MCVEGGGGKIKCGDAIVVDFGLSFSKMAILGKNIHFNFKT